MKRHSVALAVFALLSLVAPPTISRGTPVSAAPNLIVERWRGTMVVRTAFDHTEHHAPWDTGMEYLDHKNRYDLMVDEAGNVSGRVDIETTRWSFQSDPGICFFGPPGVYEDCWLTYEVTQPYSAVSVWGKRSWVNNQPVMDITGFSKLSTWKGHRSQSTTSTITGEVYAGEGYHDQDPPVDGILQRWTIQSDGAGRSPIALHTLPDLSSQAGRDQYFEDGYMIGWVNEPTVELDAELLEHSYFLDEVPVDDRFDATVEWNASGGGWVNWTLDDVNEEVGPSPATQQQKHVDVGAQILGQRLLTVEARNALNRKSQTNNSPVNIAPPPVSAGSPTNITGLKRDEAVAYSWRFKFPEPAFEAQIKQTPSWLPFFGGKPLGLKETQIEVKEDVLSTGDGVTEGMGQTGLEAMGGAIIGSVNFKGSAQNGPQGPTHESAVEFKLGGKVEKEEPLLKVVPPLIPIVEFFESTCPVCSRVLRDHAKAKAEIELTGAAAFVAKDQGQGTEFDHAEFTFGPALEIQALVSLIEDMLEASIGAGGDASITFQVPSPYFKEAGTKFKVFGRVIVLLHESGFEKTWEYKSSSATGSPEEPAPAAAPAPATWQIMDRSYLGDPDYAQWLGGVITATNLPADLLLQQNIFPQANPAIAAYNNTRLLVWAHDKVGSDALAGQEIAYSWTTGEGPGCYNCPTNWQPWKQITNDNVADLNPKVAMINANSAIAVWQRFDTSTPGDFGADPLGYLSHLQIGAAKWTRGVTETWSAPRQLSVSGALSARPQVGATSTGAMVVWVRNAGNVILGDAAHPDQVQYARYTLSNNTWTTATTMISDVNGLLGMSLATNGIHAAVVYVRDTDGDIVTSGDRELFYTRWLSNAWTAPMTLTNNAVPDDSPELALDASGNPLLVWRQDGALQFLSGGWAGTPSALDFSRGDAATDSANLALTRSSDGNLLLSWQEIHRDGTWLGYAIYDAARGLWGDARSYRPPADPTAPPGTTQMMAHARAILNPPGSIYYTTTARLLVGYQLAPLGAITETTGGLTITNIPVVGKHGLHVADVPLGINLSITNSDVTVTPTVTLPGMPLTVTAVVRNSGDFSTQQGVSVTLRSWQLSDAQNLTVVATRTLPVFASGAAYTLSFTMTNPIDGNRVWAVCIDGFNDQQGCRSRNTIRETNVRDNMALIRTDGPWELLPLPTRYGATNIMVGALISRSNTLYQSDHFTAALRLDGPVGPVLGVADFGFPMTPTAQITATATVTAGQVGTGTHLLYWIVNAGQPYERSLVTRIAVLPDLYMSTDRVGFQVGVTNGLTATFGAWVQNIGSAPSHGGRLAVWDGPPGKPDSHELHSQALPDISALGGVDVTGVVNWSGISALPPERLYVVLDPDQAVAELREVNNLAIVRQRPTSNAMPSYPVYLPMLRR